MRKLLAVLVLLAVAVLPVLAEEDKVTVYRITDASIGTTRASSSYGWRIGPQSTSLQNYGYIYDSDNSWIPDVPGPASAGSLTLYITGLGETPAISAGDTITFTYLTVSGGGSQTVTAYLPAITTDGVRLYVGVSGSTFYDTFMEETAAAAVVKTPTPLPTPVPSPSVPLAINVSSAGVVTGFDGNYCIDWSDDDSDCLFTYIQQSDSNYVATWDDGEDMWTLYTGATLAYNNSSATECHSDLEGTWEAETGSDTVVVTYGDCITPTPTAKPSATPVGFKSPTPTPAPTPGGPTLFCVDAAGVSGVDGSYYEYSTFGGQTSYSDGTYFVWFDSGPGYQWLIASEHGGGTYYYYTWQSPPPANPWATTNIWGSYSSMYNPAPAVWEGNCITPTPSATPTSTPLSTRTPTPAPTPSVIPTRTPSTYVSPTPTAVPTASPVPFPYPDWEDPGPFNIYREFDGSTAANIALYSPRMGTSFTVASYRNVVITDLSWTCASEADIDIRWSVSQSASASGELIDSVRFPNEGQGKVINLVTPRRCIRAGEYPSLHFNASSAGVVYIDGYVE